MAERERLVDPRAGGSRDSCVAAGQVVVTEWLRTIASLLIIDRSDGLMSM